MAQSISIETRSWECVKSHGSRVSTKENQPDAPDEDSPVEEKTNMKMNKGKLHVWWSCGDPCRSYLLIFPNVIVLKDFWMP